MRLTILRQRRRAKPKAPRMAPTTIKTVPSGRLDCCMNGAFFVGGTLAGGYVGMTPGPVRVGKPVKPPPVVAPGPPVMETLLVASVVTVDPVLLADDFSDVEEGVEEAPFSSVVDDSPWAAAEVTRTMAEARTAGPGR